MVMLQIDLLIDPPVSESFLSEERVWTQAWAFTWKPPEHAEDVYWYWNARGGDDWYEDGDLVNGVSTSNAAVGVVVCPSCGITQMYSSGTQLGPGVWGDQTPFAAEHTFEFATTWRPFGTAWQFISGIGAALMFALVIYWAKLVGKRK